MLATLAAGFEKLAGEGRLRMEDPLQAADHFAGLLLWIPLNKAMFTGGTYQPGQVELHRHADAAARAFLAAYRSTDRAARR